MTIKAIYFDAAGTLIKPARRVGESYAALAEKYGKSVTAGEIFERFRICFDASPRLAFPNAPASEIGSLERQWWKNLVAQVFLSWGRFDHFDEYFDELFAYYARPTAWALYPEVMETVAALMDRGLTLAVISNFDSRLLAILDGLGAATSFADVLVSSRIGYAKPDREIFDAALTRHGLQPTDALHVGDSATHDLQGAQNAGLRALLIDRSQPTECAELNRISSLGQIVSLLDEQT